MKHRKLRIAWSLLWGLTSLLLSLMWVRSYRDFDDELKYVAASGHGWYIDSLNGGVVFVTSRHNPMDPGQWRGYGAWEPGPLGFERFTTASSSSFRIPYWFAVLTTTLCASAPWYVKRFSLRTLLIATTLVAVLLGLIVWL